MSEPVRLYFDASCGPCTVFARVSGAMGRGRIRLGSLSGPEADRELGGMVSEERFGAFHLVGAAGITTGEEAVVPLVGLTFGRAAERVAVGVRPFRQLLQWTYRQFWSYRRERGCAAPTG